MKTSEIIANLLAGRKQLSESLQRGGARVKNELYEKKEQVKNGVSRIKMNAKEKAVEYLVREALHRDEPRAMTKLIHAMETVIGGKEVMNAMKQSEQTLLALPTKRVTMLSHDGELLVGHLLSCDNPKRIIIAFHGWRSSYAKDFGMFCEYWKKAQCEVLLVEQRGQHESSGDYMGFGLLERYDCLDWINWTIENLPEKLPIYLQGISMGAATVLMATGFQLGGRVHGVIADCGYTSPDAIWMKVSDENFHVSYTRISNIAKELCKQKINMGLDEYSVPEAMKVNKTPILFVHGKDDHFVPAEMTIENHKACKAPKRLLLVEGADHAMSYYKNPKEYEKEMNAFFSEFDEGKTVSK